MTGDADFTDPVSLSSALTVIVKHPRKSQGLRTNENQPPEAIATEALTAAINALKAYAQKNGAVYASGADIPENPPGGIAYCTGEPDGWSKKGKGCFIFEGEVSAQGSGVDIESIDGFPALIVLSAEGPLNSERRSTARSDTEQGLKVNGHAEIHGVILVGQSAIFNGTADFFAGEGGQGFALPPEESTTDNVVITAWH